jgi:hypothetical protein
MTTPKEYAQALLDAAYAKARNEMKANLKFMRENGIETFADLDKFRNAGGKLPGASSYQLSKVELEAIETAAGPKPRGRPMSESSLVMSHWARNTYPEYLDKAKQRGEPDPKGAALDDMSREFEVSADTLSTWIWPRGNK